MIKYSCTIMCVKYVEASVVFYEKAFGFERKFITTEGDYAELISGDTTLAFAVEALALSNLSKGFKLISLGEEALGFELGFVVEDVEQAVNQAVKVGGQGIWTNKSKTLGQTVAYLTDCNGFLIELCTPMRA